MVYYVTSRPDELYHYGIKGQKWGVRRYQNKDGTLTAAGKKRQAKIEAKAQKKLQKKQNKWERNVKNNWVTPYNNAADKINKRIDAFNDEWGDKASTSNKAYVKAYCDMWNDIYVKELETSFGKSPIDTGRKWCEMVPMFMDPESEWD